MLKRVVAIFDTMQKVRKSPGTLPEMVTSAIWKEYGLGVKLLVT